MNTFCGIELHPFVIKNDGHAEEALVAEADATKIVDGAAGCAPAWPLYRPYKSRTIVSGKITWTMPTC